MGGYAVDPAELENAAASLQSAVGGSRSALSPLRVSANRLLTSRWQGAAAAAYRLGWEQWLEGVEAMLAALDELALALANSANGYAATEEAVRTSVVRATS